MEAPRRLKGLNRLVWALAGIGWFLWFAYEDRSFAPILLLSGIFGAAIGLTLFRRLTKERRFTRRQIVVRTTISGLIAGAAVPLSAVLLILLKVALHDHPVPDFSQSDVELILGRLPVWLLVGAVIGLGAGMLIQPTAGNLNHFEEAEGLE